jgi:hypothetical protein
VLKINQETLATIIGKETREVGGEAGIDRLWPVVPNFWRPYSFVFVYLQTDAHFAGSVVGEVNAGLFKDFLNLEGRGEVSFHHSFILLDPLERGQTDPGFASKLTLAPP